MIKLIKLLKELQAKLIRHAITKAEARLHAAADECDAVDDLADKRIEMADKLYAHLLERAELKRKASSARVELERKAASDNLVALNVLKAEA